MKRRVRSRLSGLPRCAAAPAVALLPKGRWPKMEAGGGNVNTLNPGLRSDLGDSSAVHGTEVTVSLPTQRISPAPA